MPATAIAPEETLSRAAAAIDAGHHQKGAQLAYQAAWDTLCNKAANHGRQLNDDSSALSFSQWLDDNNPEEPISYDLNGAPIGRKPNVAGGFIIAMAFKEIAETPWHVQRSNTDRYWEPHEYQRYLNPVKTLVSTVPHLTPQDET